MLTPVPQQHSVGLRVSGGGAAAVATAPIGSSAVPAKTLTREELATRADALALRIGTKVTASTVLLAAVVVILIGAQSLLSTMEAMDRDIKAMSKQLAIANGGLAILNKTMESVPPTAQHMDAIVTSVEGTAKEVQTSADHINTMGEQTAALNEDLGSIASSTKSMSTSLQSAADNSAQIAGTVDALNEDIAPLVNTQHQLLLGTVRMRGGVDGMNSSLAYVVRVLNYITRPPTGGGLMIRADLPKQTLPPIPGIRAEVEPISVFPRDVWPVYTGP